MQAIAELKREDPSFEMYVMLGAWIDCLNAWTDSPDHSGEDSISNAIEVDSAITMASKYPDIVKIIAIGNEAMVRWAAPYYVQPEVILKWVKYTKQARIDGELPAGSQFVLGYGRTVYNAVHDYVSKNRTLLEEAAGFGLNIPDAAE